MGRAIGLMYACGYRLLECTSSASSIHNGALYTTYKLPGYVRHTRSKPRKPLSPCHRARCSEREEYTYMIALREQDMEKSVWLSTDAPDEFPSLSPVDDRDERLLTFAHNDDVLSALEPGEATWEDTDAEEPPLEEAPTSEIALEAEDPETDNVLAQYFGEVRRFALLSFAEEQALGRRIKRWQRRVRWALYTSPVALPTLLRLQHRVEHQGVSLHEIVQHREETTPDQAAWLVQCRQAIACLQELAARLGRLERRSGMPQCVAQERRVQRHERCRLWRVWLTTCEALQLHPRVHEAMREALEDA